MFCLGLSSAIKHENYLDFEYVVRRVGSLTLIAILITAVTYYFERESFVYFGAIHAIAVNSVLHLPFLHNAKLAGLVAVGILLYNTCIGEFPLEVPKEETLDYIPWFSNLGFVLLGVLAHSQGLHRVTNHLVQDPWFNWAGQQALWIYLSHQALIFTIVALHSAA